LLVALLAGFVGLLELDWSQLFGDPAREALRELWAEVQGWEDFEATVTVWGLGQEPVRMRIQALLREGAWRLEFLEPSELRGQIYTYRKGMLVHFRPGNGGLRVVHVLGERGVPPEFEINPQALQISLEEPESFASGWEEKETVPLRLPGLAGTAPSDSGLATRDSAPSSLVGFRKLRIAGLPEPVQEMVVWLDERGKPRGGTIQLETTKVTLRLEELQPNQGFTLFEVLELPRAEETLWYGEDQSM